MSDFNIAVVLQSSGNHWAIKLLRKGMEPLGLMFPAWCFRLLLAIPGATGDWYAFKDYVSCDLMVEILSRQDRFKSRSSVLRGEPQDVRSDDLLYFERHD